MKIRKERYQVLVLVSMERGGSKWMGSSCDWGKQGEVSERKNYSALRACLIFTVPSALPWKGKAMLSQAFPICHAQAPNGLAFLFLFGRQVPVLFLFLELAGTDLAHTEMWVMLWWASSPRTGAAFGGMTSWEQPPLQKDVFWHQVKWGSMYILQVRVLEERGSYDTWRLLVYWYL